MFGLFKKDPRKKLEKEIATQWEKARDIQRSGDLKAYAALVEKIENMEKQLEEFAA